MMCRLGTTRHVGISCICLTKDNQSSGESDRGGDATEVEAVKLEMTVMTMEMMLRRMPATTMMRAPGTS